MPVLVEKKSGGFVMITESDLYNYPGIWVRKDGISRLSAIHPKYPKTLTTHPNRYVTREVKEPHDYIARVAGKRNYPPAG